MDIVSLIRSYVEGLLEAENRFIEHLDSFPELEKTVVELSNRMAAGFLGAVLTTADDLICESGIRKKEYTVQRKRMRTLISSVGDVTFTHTLYKDKQGQTKCLLDDQIRLPDRSRQQLLGYRAYEIYTSYGTGVHFGGNPSKDPVLAFDNLGYADRTKVLRPGIGLIPEANGEHQPERIIIPLARFRKTART